MYMSERETTIKIVNLLTILAEAGERGCAGYPIWDELRDHCFGNQEFGNDRVFLYCLSDEGDDAISEVEGRLRKLCKDSISEVGAYNVIAFNVCW